MPREIISEEEISLPLVKKIISKRGKEGDLSFQQTITLEHSSTFAKMTPAVAVKVMEKLMETYSLSRMQAVQIVNIAPTTLEELKTIIDAKSTNLTQEQFAEIVDLITKSRS